MPNADPRAQLDDLSLVRGDVFSWTYTIKGTNADGSTFTVDLTSYGTTWSGQLRGSSSGDYFTDAFIWNIDSSNASTGVLVLSLTAAQTALMNADTYYFDLQVTGGSVSPQTPFKGVVHVFKDVTR